MRRLMSPKTSRLQCHLWVKIICREETYDRAAVKDWDMGTAVVVAAQMVKYMLQMHEVRASIPVIGAIF